MQTTLNIKNLHAGYGDIRIIHDASLEFAKGEVVALMGPNGAGKSTILKAVFGLADITSGSIHWQGDQIKKPRPHELVSMGIAYVPQGRRVFTHLTVEENLEIGGFIIKDKQEVKRRIENLMDLFPDLKTKRKDPSGSLSGGQQQMLAIARGMVTNPQFLLLDEPTLGLSPKLVKVMFQKIKEINDATGMGVLMVEHNIKSLLGIVHRAYVLAEGKIVSEGPAEKFAEGDILERVFMGKGV